MDQDPKGKQMVIVRKAMQYLGLLMVLLYVAIGILVLINPNALFSIADQYIVPVGSGLILYGVFRAYRYYKKYFSNNE